MVRKISRVASSLLLALVLLAYPLAINVPLVHAEEPATYLVAWPSNPTADTTATFDFASSGNEVTYECSVDDGGFVECEGPFTTSTLAAGQHNFQVRAVSPENEPDSSPESYTWNILDSSETFTGDTTVSGYANHFTNIPDLQIAGSHNPTLTIKLEATNGSLRLENDADLIYYSSQEDNPLIISGLQNDLNFALTSLIYEPTSAGDFTIDASIINEGYGYDSATGHVYQLITDALSWTNARSQSNTMTYGGLPGYLATITSEEESDVISAKYGGLGNAPWIAASDLGQEGIWAWQDGPEDSTQFWQGLGPDEGGQPLLGGYNSWGGAQPDNSGGDENCATALIGNDSTTWNDASCASNNAYLVEFGQDSNLPELATYQIEVSVTEATPTEISDCNELQSIVMSGVTLDGDYILANDIDCDGQEYGPIGDTPGPFTGTFNGAGHTIKNVDVWSGASEKGIFGAAEGAVIRSLHIQNINAPGGGGLVGKAVDVILSDIYAEDITAAGGLIGNTQSGETYIERSFASGILTGYNSGGLAARTDGSATIITDSYADVALSGVNIGGLVGTSDSNLTIQSSYARVSLDSGGQQTAGGLLGSSGQPEITDSFAVVTNDGGNASHIGGLVATDSGAEFVDNSYFYFDSDEDIFCDSASTPSGCTEVDNPDYFLGGDNVSAPLDIWEDGDVWNVSESDQLPTFAVGKAMCDDPDQPANSITIICQFQRELQHQYTGDLVSAEYRYRPYFSDDEWQYGEWSGNGEIQIDELEPNTVYALALHADWEIHHSDWNDPDNIAILTTAPPADFDLDGDGIPNLVEDAGPNDGDANGNLFDDGVTISGLDRDEGNVTSLVNAITGKYSVLETDCNLNQNVSVAGESSAHKDAAYDYTLGLISFSATGCDELVTVTQYFYGSYNPSDYTARKYNSNTNSYTTIPGAVFSQVTIGGQKALKLAYQLADNGPLDQDPTTGTISDPAGPANAVLGVPNTGLSH